MTETVEALAEKIRHKVDRHFSSKVHPHLRHLHDAAVSVAKHLGMEADALNIRHVMSLLSDHAKPAEYPKMKFHHGEEVEKIVHSPEEEAALGPDWVDKHWRAADHN
jgi:hypothetical protein